MGNGLQRGLGSVWVRGWLCSLAFESQGNLSLASLEFLALLSLQLTWKEQLLKFACFADSHCNVSLRSDASLLFLSHLCWGFQHNGSQWFLPFIAHFMGSSPTMGQSFSVIYSCPHCISLFTQSRKDLPPVMLSKAPAVCFNHILVGHRC